METVEEYVQARRVLLDALAALEPHLDNLILIGAQAVYLHTGESDLNVPLMTTDGDLAMNTTGLADVPEIGGAMRAAGFSPGANPGRWLGGGDVAIDLMVAPHQARTAKRTARAARLAPHSKETARIAKGLEPSLVDNSVFKIASFSADDSREVRLRVAGPAALLTAKAIKIGERLRQSDIQPDRLKQKDALDVFRVLRAIQTKDLVDGFRKHREVEEARAASEEAMEILRENSTSREGRIVQLAVEAASGDPTVAPSFVALAALLQKALESDGW